MTTQYTSEMTHRSVANGAKWLDEHCPTWFEEINLDQLDLSNPTLCVLGQTAKCLLDLPLDRNLIVGGFHEVTEAVHWRPSSPLYVGLMWQTYEYGFDVPVADSERENRARYEMLTIAWRELIRQRLEASK